MGVAVCSQFHNKKDDKLKSDKHLLTVLLFSWTFTIADFTISYLARIISVTQQNNLFFIIILKTSDMSKFRANMKCETQGYL